MAAADSTVSPSPVPRTVPGRASRTLRVRAPRPSRVGVSLGNSHQTVTALEDALRELGLPRGLLLALDADLRVIATTPVESWSALADDYCPFIYRRQYQALFREVVQGAFAHKAAAVVVAVSLSQKVYDDAGGNSELLKLANALNDTLGSLGVELLDMGVLFDPVDEDLPLAAWTLAGCEGWGAPSRSTHTRAAA